MTGAYTGVMPITRNEPKAACFNKKAKLPYRLRINDFELAMRDVYDFFFDVNQSQLRKNLGRLDETVRPAIMSGLISDMLSASLASHSRALTINRFFNGHPDLVVKGKYANDSAMAGIHGVEVKSTRKKGGAVDTHGGRDQWFCVFVYKLDVKTEPAVNRKAMTFTEVYLGQVKQTDFRKNERGERGTRTATLAAAAMGRLRKSWIYLDT